MKKIIPLVCCMILFSITACNADTDVEKLKGCWKNSIYGTINSGHIEIGDNYEKNLDNGEVFELLFETTDTHIAMRTTHPELKKHVPDAEEVFYINRKSITDTSFRQSNKKEESPDEGLQFNRIQCPSK